MFAVGRLSVISWGFLAVLCTAAVVTWAGCWAIRHARHRGLVVAVAALAFLLSLGTAADAVNAHFEYLPRVADVIGQRTWPTASRAVLQQLVAERQSDAPAGAAPVVAPAQPAHTPTPAASEASDRHQRGYPQGAVVTIHVPDAGVGFAATDVLVYLPPQYFTELAARFPVVYLLHGSPGVPIDWLRGGDAAHAALLAAQRDHPQILVMPHVSRSWLDDSECVDGAHEFVESYIVHDLIPGVDAKLRTLPGSSYRTVAGMSAGGYCALNIGLRHRELFGSIVDMSGYTHPTHAGGMAALFGHRSDLAQVVAANSPDAYVDTLANTERTRIYLLCGTGDHDVLAQMSSLRDRLRARGFAVTWMTRPGGHTFGVWRPGLLDALAWTPT